jgi:hypothetical protein
MGSRFHAKTPAFAKAAVGKQRHKEEGRGRQYVIINFQMNYEKLERREKILEGRPPCRPHSTNDYE